MRDGVQSRAELLALLVDRREAELHGRDARAERGDGAFDRVGPQRVVGVEEEDDVAARGGEAGIVGGGLARILAEDRLHAAAELVDDFGRSVGRAVVDDDHLEMRPCLRERAADRAAEKPRVIEVRDDD
jgi:hypothetical protein